MNKPPAQMTAVAISKPGGPEVLIPETRAVPVPRCPKERWSFATTTGEHNTLYSAHFRSALPGSVSRRAIRSA